MANGNMGMMRPPLLPFPSTPEIAKQAREQARHYLPTESQLRINNLLYQIEEISDQERLYLYLNLPTQTAQQIEKIREGQRLNIPGHKQDAVLPFYKQTLEIQARRWVLDNLEVCKDTSLARVDIYSEYQICAKAVSVEMLSHAEFGKIVRACFPNIRLEKMGKSESAKYCYAGLRRQAWPRGSTPAPTPAPTTRDTMFRPNAIL